MKKLLIFCITLIMMSSCVKHANIYMKLTDEDAAAIPYQMDQTVDFVDQSGDTLTYKVTYDETYPYDIDRYYNRLGPDDKPYYDNYSCYARTVILDCDWNGSSLGFTVLPEKEIYFYFGTDIDLNGSLLNPAPYTVEGADYENVLHGILYSQDTGELIYEWAYNEEYGLIQVKYYDKSLTRVP